MNILVFYVESIQHISWTSTAYCKPLSSLGVRFVKNGALGKSELAKLNIVWVKLEYMNSAMQSLPLMSTYILTHQHTLANAVYEIKQKECNNNNNNNPVTTAIWLVFFGLIILSILHRTMDYASSVHSNLGSLWLKLLYSL
jgi:hypothetical protein